MDVKSLFMEFHYPQLKDIIFHFLTLATGILTFSVMFSDKLAEKWNHGNKGKISLFSAWLFFIASLILAGIALIRLVVAGEFAKGGDILTSASYYFGGVQHMEQHVLGVYILMFLAGVSFVTGLALLTVTAFINVFRKV